jgi:hypothetical protein
VAVKPAGETGAVNQPVIPQSPRAARLQMKPLKSVLLGLPHKSMPDLRKAFLFIGIVAVNLNTSLNNLPAETFL